MEDDRAQVKLHKIQDQNSAMKTEIEEAQLTLSRASEPFLHTTTLGATLSFALLMFRSSEPMRLKSKNYSNTRLESRQLP